MCVAHRWTCAQKAEPGQPLNTAAAQQGLLRPAGFRWRANLDSPATACRPSTQYSHHADIQGKDVQPNSVPTPQKT